jgi:hypothetical protein
MLRPAPYLGEAALAAAHLRPPQHVTQGLQVAAAVVCRRFYLHSVVPAPDTHDEAAARTRPDLESCGLSGSASVGDSSSRILLTAQRHGRLTGEAEIVREVALGTWSVRLHNRTVVRPGCVLLGGKAPNVL